MSTVSRRPRVRSISSVVLEAAAIGCVQALSTMIEDAIRSLDAPSRTAWNESGAGVSAPCLASILPLSAINGQIPRVKEGIRRELASHGLTAVESTKLEALMTLQVTPFACAPAAIEPSMEALVKAGTLDETERAVRQVLAAAEVSHQGTLTCALLTACKNASLEAGFPSVETVQGVDGAIRVIGTDTNGRALITEVRPDPRKDLSIETEVVGVTDGSCIKIMDSFDRALEQQGVRTETPVRKATSGVCELNSAKEFMKRMGLHSATRKHPSQRTQRLNRTPRIPVR